MRFTRVQCILAAMAFAGLVTGALLLVAFFASQCTAGALAGTFTSPHLSRDASLITVSVNGTNSGWRTPDGALFAQEGEDAVFYIPPEEFETGLAIAGGQDLFFAAAVLNQSGTSSAWNATYPGPFMYVAFVVHVRSRDEWVTSDPQLSGLPNGTSCLQCAGDNLTQVPCCDVRMTGQAPSCSWIPLFAPSTRMAEAGFPF